MPVHGEQELSDGVECGQAPGCSLNSRSTLLRHLVRLHSAGEIADGEAVLTEDAGGVIRALADAAVDPDLAVTRQFAQPGAKLAQGDVHAVGYGPGGRLGGGANVDNQRLSVCLRRGARATRTNAIDRRRREARLRPRSRPCSPDLWRCRIEVRSKVRPLRDRRSWLASG